MSHRSLDLEPERHANPTTHLTSRTNAHRVLVLVLMLVRARFQVFL